MHGGGRERSLRSLTVPIPEGISIQIQDDIFVPSGNGRGFCIGILSSDAEHFLCPQVLMMVNL